MSNTELVRVIGKLQKLKALHRARARVQQLERELRGEPARAEEPVFVPDFLHKQVAGGLATTTDVLKRSRRVSSERPLTLEMRRRRAVALPRHADYSGLRDSARERLEQVVTPLLTVGVEVTQSV